MILSAFIALAGFLPQGKAQEILNSAGSFAVLGGTTVTSTGYTALTGDLGVSPGGTITGFGPGNGTVSGTTYTGGSVADAAQADVLCAYNLLAGEAVTQDLTGKDLGGLTNTPGVYYFNAAAQLTGILTLDAQGDSNARFDFQIGSTLTTASDSSIVLLNCAQAGNVYWQVGTSATIGLRTAFDGNILADQSITMNTSASLTGRALAMNAAVSLDNNAITIPVGVPEPESFWLLIFSGSVFGVWRWWVGRRRKAYHSQ